VSDQRNHTIPFVDNYRTDFGHTRVKLNAFDRVGMAERPGRSGANHAVLAFSQISSDPHHASYQPPYTRTMGRPGHHKTAATSTNES
jgi:hypothetical protein